MNNLKLKNFLIGMFLITFFFIIDRASKLFVLNILEQQGNVDIYINNYLNIILVWNKGIGFGLLSSENQLYYLSITLLIVIINLIIVYLILYEKGINFFFLILILSGSLGNLFDRLYYKAVPDFIDFHYNNYHWFIFNVADILITIGIIFLITFELFKIKINE